METVENRIYDGIIVGIAVRRQIAHTYIFRVRRGSGYYGSIAGKFYQDKYAYVVPSSINNPEGQAARNALSAAVANWQGFSDAQKAGYNRRAQAGRLKMSGYNLYLREYIKANA